MPRSKDPKDQIDVDKPKKDGSGVLQVWQAAFDEALSDELRRVRFVENPSGKLFSLAYKAAGTHVNEYVRKRLSDADFAKYLKTRDVLEQVVSYVAATPMKRMLYWAEGLGICKPDDDLEHVLGAVSRYLIARHRIQDYTVQRMNPDAVADILEHDAAKRVVDKSDATTPGSDARVAEVDKAELPPARHSPDFRSVHWYGSDYSFTALQAAVVRELWAASEQQTPDLSDAYLLTRAESQGDRLGDLFKGHASWGTMIVEGATKGTRRLNRKNT